MIANFFIAGAIFHHRLGLLTYWQNGNTGVWIRGSARGDRYEPVRTTEQASQVTKSIVVRVGSTTWESWKWN